MTLWERITEGKLNGSITIISLIGVILCSFLIYQLQKLLLRKNNKVTNKVEFTNELVHPNISAVLPEPAAIFPKSAPILPELSAGSDV